MTYCQTPSVLSSGGLLLMLLNIYPLMLAICVIYTALVIKLRKQQVNMVTDHLTVFDL